MAYLAHTGTFDVENYGDLLFPLLLAKRLPGYEVRPVSPCGGNPVWSDCVSSAPLEGLLGSKCRGIIVGGGNIIHPNPSSLARYRKCGADIRGYADLWIGAALAAGKDVPVLWNACGVPRPIGTEFAEIAREALLRTDYLSVRDELSRKYLQNICPDLEIAVVPDSAWDLPSLWTADELDSTFAALTGGTPGDCGRHVAIHLNRRYTKDVGDIALGAIIDGLCDALDARPILVAIGPCHEDDVFARAITPYLSREPIILDRPQSLRQVCAAISRSDFYVGSSMHGYITAAAFGVPAVVVARKMIKFSGAVHRAGAPETLVRSWKKVPGAVRRIDRDALSATFLQSQKAASAELTAHWSAIASQIDRGSQMEATLWDPSALHAYRARFQDICTRQKTAGKLPTRKRIGQGLKGLFGVKY
ncbi:polysaccharide pyruvyl transferase family protein [Rhodovulum marinum]|uniref:Polysaccharide pyruvyl transferase n=1 Tax=Rhodovulum marinum TaxID=320662 RepID=A0A4R2PV51_9RHOB|nr:polysaccharide pyruvyl transferase family protein [Rhodovulum marinum]TCP39819.1 polysaccharide pyruvyl transferase [Rhodovulum marinum]